MRATRALIQAMRRILVEKRIKIPAKRLLSTIPQMAPALNHTKPNSDPNCRDVNKDLIMIVIANNPANRVNFGILARNAREKNMQTPNQLRPVTKAS